MKKLCVAIGAAALVTAGAPVGASPLARTVEEPYSGANGARTSSGEAHWFTGTSEEVRFESKRGERTVAFAIQDQSGQPAFGQVYIFDRSDEIVEQWAFCNATEAPMPIPANVMVEVRLMGGTCDDGSPAVVTTGVVVATFGR